MSISVSCGVSYEPLSFCRGLLTEFIAIIICLRLTASLATPFQTG